MERVSVTVRDLLRLDLLSGARIVAGADGLDRVISRVNFTDTPINEAVDYKLLAEGDVFICSFYAGQNNEEFLYQNIAFYIRAGSACCIALDEFVPHFPQRVLDLANEHHYPILHIKGTTPYGELIRSITLLIFLDRDDQFMESRIGQLVNGSSSAAEIAQLYQSVVSNRSEQYVVAHVMLENLNAMQYKMLKDDLAMQFRIRFMPYYNGGFFVLPGENAVLILDHVVRALAHYSPKISVGYSEVCVGKEAFPGAFSQALSADETARSLGLGRIGYESLSIYKLLIPLQSSRVLEQFCNEVLEPLHKANLLETVETYFQCDGNVEKTAELLAQHKNTVRFRINKARGLLGMEHSYFSFVEKVSLALKAERLLKSS